jgi:hypothetical protein
MGLDDFKRNVVLYTSVLTLTLLAYRSLLLYHLPHFHDLVEVYNGVLNGTPRGIAFQNRLLGPYITDLITLLGFTPEAALKIFHLLGLCLQSMLMTFLLRRIGLGALQTAGMVAIFLFLFLTFQFYWYHTWDILDIIIFTLFSYMILVHANILYFTLLFIIALFNRESALFIPLYLIVSALRGAKAPHLRIESARRLLAGLFLMVAGVLWVHFVRRALFVGLPEGVPDTQGTVIGNEIHLVGNLSSLFIGNFRGVDMAFSAFLILAFCGLLAAAPGMIRPQRDLLGLACAVFLAILTFGIVEETRNFFTLFPMMIFSWASLAAARNPAS